MRVSSKTSSIGATQGGTNIKPASPSTSVAPNQGPASVEDALSVSGMAQFIAAAEAHIAQIPDVRVEKVEALKAMMDTQQYHPDGEAVAEGIVKEHLPIPKVP